MYDPAQPAGQSMQTLSPAKLTPFASAMAWHASMFGTTSAPQLPSALLSAMYTKPGFSAELMSQPGETGGGEGGGGEGGGGLGGGEGGGGLGGGGSGGGDGGGLGGGLGGGGVGGGA